MNADGWGWEAMVIGDRGEGFVEEFLAIA